MTRGVGRHARREELRDDAFDRVFQRRHREPARPRARVRERAVGRLVCEREGLCPRDRGPGEQRIEQTLLGGGFVGSKEMLNTRRAVNAQVVSPHPRWLPCR